MTKLAKLIATREGFFKSGTLPARNHNPGDLRHSPHSVHTDDPNSIGAIDDDADGWADLERQLTLYADRGMTLSAVVYVYAPPSENDSASYLDFLIQSFGGLIDADTPLRRILEIPA